MQWYCVEYWSNTLQLDIVELKTRNAHRISVRPLVHEFLTACANTNRPYLVTNAHRHSINLKLRQVGLRGYFEDIICSHDYGVPKERLEFWQGMNSRYDFEPARALFIDDNLSVLRAAREFGIAHLFAIHQPDSGRPGGDAAEFAAIRSFAQIMPG